jgi:aldose 1-epimerase
MKLSKFTVACLGVAGTIAVPFAHAGVSRTDWGKTKAGTPVSLYTLQDKDLTVKITTFGARIVSILAPDRSGHKADVVLGYDNVGSYETDTTTYFGAIVGRYGNRIKAGTFSLDGHTYHVPVNNNGNALHGGPEGYSTKVWQAKELPNGVEMTMISPDGDMGFPGQLTLHVDYTLEASTLRITYTATTTKPTVLNPTNHSYFNLRGDGKGTILDEVMMIDADRYTPTDKVSIPTGQLAPVAGTPFDFRKPTPIGARIHDDNPQLELAKGYDHNFVLSSKLIDGLRLSAVVYDPTTGRTLTEKTTEPGVQFYSGNFLDGTQHGKYGVSYQQYAGFCLETQHFPPNEPSFPSTVLRPGQTFHSETEYIFGVK